MVGQYFPSIHAQLMIDIIYQEIYPTKIAYHKHESVANHDLKKHTIIPKQTNQLNKPKQSFKVSQENEI